MTDKTENAVPETAAEALKRVVAAKKAGSTAGGPAFKAGQHPEKAASAKSAAMAKPAARNASKRG